MPTQVRRDRNQFWFSLRLAQLFQTDCYLSEKSIDATGVISIDELTVF